MNRRRAAIAETKRRLSTIRKADGFHTDAGLVISVGEAYQLGEDDPDVALAMIINDEVLIQYQGDLKIALHLPIEVVVLVKPDLEDVIGSIEDGIEDVKIAMETGDRQFDGILVNTLRRGAVRTLPRETGSQTAGAIIPYTLPFSESYGGL